MIVSTLLVGALPAFAYEIKDNPDNMDYVSIHIDYTKLGLDTASVTGPYKFITGYQYYSDGQKNEDRGVQRIIVYDGTINKGTTTLPTGTLTFKDAAFNESGKTYDLKMSFTPTIIASDTYKGYQISLIRQNSPATSLPSYANYWLDEEISSVYTRVGYSIKTTLEVLGASDDDTMLMYFCDLDVPDSYSAMVLNGQQTTWKHLEEPENEWYGENNTDGFPWSEAIEITGGIQSAVYTSDANGTSMIRHNFAQTRFWGSALSENGPESAIWYNASAKSNSFTWTGSSANMGTFFLSSRPAYKITATTGKGGSITMEGDETVFWKGERHYKMTPETGYRMKSLTVDGKQVANASTYDFTKVMTNHTIDVQWEKIPVTVNYQWVGEHPNKAVPSGETIGYGDTHTVDTTYKTGDTVYEENVTVGGITYPRGNWTFQGWDESGDLTLTEDTTIHGTWTFEPQWNVDTSVIGGTITNTEHNIPDGENRVVSYTPNDGYQLKTVTIDGTLVDKNEYPASVFFPGIAADHVVDVVYELIPGLSIEKTADKEIYNAGDTVTYTIQVKQTVEGAEARNVSVKDTLPEGLTLNPDSFVGEGFSIVSTDQNAYELNFASLTGDATYTYTAVTNADADAESLINVAEATAENVPADPVRDDAEVKSFLPKPVIEKIVSNENPISGEEVTYTITVKEPQEGVVLRNMSISDPLPEGIQVVDGSMETAGEPCTATISDNTLLVTADQLESEIVISFKAVVTAVEGDIDNVATLSGDQMPGPLSDNAKLTVKEPQPTLTKSVSKQRAYIGEVVTYKITAASDVELKDVVITDALPDGVEILPDTLACDKEADIAYADGVITAKFASLSEQVEISYQAKVIKVGAQKNVASLTATNFPKGPLNADATVEGFEPTPVLTKIADKNEAEIGDTVTYTIAMRTEEGVLSEAVLTDTLPDRFALDKTSVSCSSKDAEIEVSGKTITVKLPELTEESVTLTYSGKAEKAGELINVATLTGSNYTGDPIKAEAKVTVPEKPVEEEAPKETPKATPTATTKTSTPTASSGEIKSTGKVQTGDVNLALYGMIGILAFVATAASVFSGKYKKQ